MKLFRKSKEIERLRSEKAALEFELEQAQFIIGALASEVVKLKDQLRHLSSMHGVGKIK